jgi:apolipoprotein D and lipocalin family protein
MIKFLFVLSILIILTSCSMGGKMQTVKHVELERFMGSWYVIGIIPNLIEKNAVNGIESYSLNEDNSIAIEYKFHKKSPQGKLKVMHPKAWVYDTNSNAEWRVQFIWPIKFPYLIIDLAEDYSYTVIGVPNKKYVWIMSRAPEMPEPVYAEILRKLETIGYDIKKIKRMPQIWG